MGYTFVVLPEQGRVRKYIQAALGRQVRACIKYVSVFSVSDVRRCVLESWSVLMRHENVHERKVRTNVCL